MTWSEAFAAFCFGYPFVMSIYWMAGGALYRWLRERHEPPLQAPPPLAHYPPVSILVPCHNESRQLGETFAALERVQYPDFEVIAINDGSTDNTGVELDAMSQRMPH